jgi:cytochrome c biogenesis protein CcmG/thiol:disulfide interchange protein DsbE
VLIVVAVMLAIGATVYADKATRKKASDVAAGVPQDPSKSVGLPAPDFTLKDLNGKEVSLADYKGKVVLVNFWATWCTPCLGEIPELIEMQQKYGPKGFVILGLAMDDEGKSVVAPWVEKMRFDVNGQKLPMNYPILLANEDTATKFGGLIGYPTSVLVTKDGKQLKRVTGPISADEFSKAIESHL